MSFSRAQIVRANIRETNERRFTHSPIGSYLLLYLALFCDLMSSFCCWLLACEEAAQGADRQTYSFIEKLNRGRHPAWRKRRPPRGGQGAIID
jgi:hypothetical protein